MMMAMILSYGGTPYSFRILESPGDTVAMDFHHHIVITIVTPTLLLSIT